MFVLELLTWGGLSLTLVMLHLWMTTGHHARPALTAATGMMWGATGGLLGTVIQLQSSSTRGYSVLSLALAGIGTVSFLLLEWMGNKDHVASQ